MREEFLRNMRKRKEDNDKIIEEKSQSWDTMIRDTKTDLARARAKVEKYNKSLQKEANKNKAYLINRLKFYEELVFRLEEFFRQLEL